MPYGKNGRHPTYWGRWFTPVSETDMKLTNLNIFLQLGMALQDMCDHLHAGSELGELLLAVTMPREWLIAFLRETNEVGRYLKVTRERANELYGVIDGIYTPKRVTQGHATQSEEVTMLVQGARSFFEAFEREHRNLAVFTVTPKGTRDTAILIENPEEDFTETQRKILPEQFVVDLRQAARCLVFEVPTACAFHSCRATESLIIAYYELLAKKKWSFAKRDWKIYIEQLGVQHAPKKITTRLDEIRDMDRNSYAHPEVNVTREEAPILYGLCSGVNYYMVEEMVKLTT
jgi:hypothetical protein